MSERARLRLLSVALFLPILTAGAAISYLLTDEIFGQPFFSGLFFGIFYCGFILISPGPFTRSQVRERRQQMKQNRAGLIIIGALLGVVLVSLAMLFFISYVNEYRLI